jgi:hypothetical protein
MKRAGLFDQLLGVAPTRLPKSPVQQFIYEGRVITDLRQVPAGEEREAIRAAYYRHKHQVQYQRQRLNPDAMARRKAANETPERKAWKRAYDARTRHHQRTQKTVWARTTYPANAEKRRAATREYYRRNREAILARKRAERVAARESRLQAQEAAQ